MTYNQVRANIRNLLVGATIAEIQEFTSAAIDRGDYDAVEYAGEWVRELQEEEAECAGDADEDEIVDVVFLRHPDGSDVFAVFPGIAATAGDSNHALCYERVGQHGPVDIGYCAECSEVTDRDDYADLYSELGRIGYWLYVVSAERINHPSYAAERRLGC